MSVRTIKDRAGQVVGYQAVSGAGKGPGTSAYFSASVHGEAKAQATAASKAMATARPRRVYPPKGANARGIAGLRLIYVASESEHGAPILYAVATWQRAGRAFARKASTYKHGLVGSVERVMRQREKGTGQPLGLTARQALYRMKAALAGDGNKGAE